MNSAPSPACSLPGPDDIDIIVDPSKQKAWIMHRKPLPLQDSLTGMRYVRSTHQFTLLGQGGAEAHLSTITLAEPLRRGLVTLTHVTLMAADQNGNVQDIRILPLSFAD